MAEEKVSELLAYQHRSSLRHGHSSRLLNESRYSPTYTSWLAMRQRCRNEARDTESKYVNRGIGYDPTWEIFDVFLADMGERPAGTTLDRKDNNAGYSKDNCRWSTPIEQARNRRNSKLTYALAFEIAVAMMLGTPAKQLAAEYGISESLPREIAKGRTWKDAHAAAKEMVEWLNS